MAVLHIERFDDDLHKQLKALCAMEGKTIREKIIELVVAEVKRKGLGFRK